MQPLRALLTVMLVLLAYAMCGAGATTIKPSPGPPPPQRLTDGGQHCFVFDGFSDTLILDARVGAGPKLFMNLDGAMVLDPFYQAFGPGTLVKSLDSNFAYEFVLALGVVANEIFLGNNKSCTLHAYLDNCDRCYSGPWIISCFDVGEEPYQAAGTLRYMACPTVTRLQATHAHKALPSLACQGATRPCPPSR